MKNMAEKGELVVKKTGFYGLKANIWAYGIMGWRPN